MYAKAQRTITAKRLKLNKTNMAAIVKTGDKRAKSK